MLYNEDNGRDGEADGDGDADEHGDVEGGGGMLRGMKGEADSDRDGGGQVEGYGNGNEEACEDVDGNGDGKQTAAQRTFCLRVTGLDGEGGIHVQVQGGGIGDGDTDGDGMGKVTEALMGMEMGMETPMGMRILMGMMGTMAPTATRILFLSLYFILISLIFWHCLAGLGLHGIGWKFHRQH